MFRLTAIGLFVFGMLVCSGCGGPGEAVTQRPPTDDTPSDNGGTQATDDQPQLASPGRGARGRGNAGGRNNGEDQQEEGSEEQQEGESGDENAEGAGETGGDEATEGGGATPDDTPGVGDGTPDPNAQRDPNPNPPRGGTGWTPGRPNRPEGLSMGGGSGKGGDRRQPNRPDDAPTPPTNPGDVAGGGRNNVPAEVRRFTFFERANYAFSTENETEGFQYLYAHAITEEGALSDHPIHWFGGLNEPRLSLRWGVAVEYSEGRHEGDPPRFGDTSDEGTGRSGGGDFGGGGGGLDVGDRLPNGQRINRNRGNNNNDGGEANVPSGENPTELLTYYTSEFGERLLKRLESRRTTDEAFWGQALHDVDATKDLDDIVSQSGPGNSNRGRRGRGGGGGQGIGLDDAAPPAAGGNDPNAAAPVETLPANFEPEFEAPANSLVPGVVMVGVMKEKEAIEAARAHGVDLLAFFDLKAVATSRTDPKLNAKLRVFNVKTGEEIGETRQLNSIAYNKALADDRDNQIEEELDRLFGESIDESYKSGEMIDIPDKYLAKRIDDLIQGVGDNPLPALVEITYYHNSNMITKQEYTAAAEALIGPENARMLVDGEIEDREKALREWLPGQYSVNVPDADFR